MSSILNGHSVFFLLKLFYDSTLEIIFMSTIDDFKKVKMGKLIFILDTVLEDKIK